MVGVLRQDLCVPLLLLIHLAALGVSFGTWRYLPLLLRVWKQDEPTGSASPLTES